MIFSNDNHLLIKIKGALYGAVNTLRGLQALTLRRAPLMFGSE